MRTKCPIDVKEMTLERQFISFYYTQNRNLDIRPSSACCFFGDMGYGPTPVAVMPLICSKLQYWSPVQTFCHHHQVNTQVVLRVDT